MRSIYLVTMPYNYLTLPSLSMALYHSCLEEVGLHVESRCLDMEFAHFCGGELYRELHHEFAGEAIFSSLLFPELASSLQEYSDSLEEHRDIHELACMVKECFESFLEKDKDYLSSAPLVLLPIFSKQIFPALYLAKLIKKKYACTVWLSGYHCQEECGISLLQCFPQIDRVFGENAYRTVREACLNELKQHKTTEKAVVAYRGDLSDFPPPNYDAAVNLRRSMDPDFVATYIPHFWLQVEHNRGCCWDKCSFCTLNCQHAKYEPRPLKQLLDDYAFIQKKYHTTQVLNSEFHSGPNWREVLQGLCTNFPGLKGMTSAYLPVKSLKNESDLQLLACLEAPVLCGVESFSKKALRLLNKRHTPIEAIAVLKFAERYKVKFSYNLMFCFPFEDEEFVHETNEVIESILHLPPPFSLEELRITYGSEMFKNPGKFGITKLSLRRSKEYELLPKSLHSSYTPFFFDFNAENDPYRKDIAYWEDVIRRWCEVYYRSAYAGVPKNAALLNRKWNQWCLEIRDSRVGSHIYLYDGFAKDLYLYCDQIRTYEECCAAFPSCNSAEIETQLTDFVEKKLMWKEDARYVSLAV